MKRACSCRAKLGDPINAERERRCQRVLSGGWDKTYRCKLGIKPELPDGLFEVGGKVMFTCRGCDQSVPLEVDVSEFDPEVAYCGGSPRCLP